ncbi:MAG: nucleotide pyrophosphohydrolase [bacterium]|jgi:NTP pyrophosphatase (non-canonical NTP hydrolase)
MKDSTTTIDKIKKKIARFVNEREWEPFHSPKNLSMSITIEAAELMELFQWMDVEEARSKSALPDLRRQIEEEIADIAIYILSLCNTLKLDLSACIASKVKKNREKYPADKCKGTW